jgi:DNA-binding LacI/PurR family transcriptional regulator
MKVQTIVSSLAVSFALVAGAQAGTPRGDINNTPFQGVYGQNDSSSVTREQVAADLQQARANGVVLFGDSDNVPFAAQASTPSVPAAQVDANSVHGDVAFGDIDNQPFQGV